MTKEKHPLLLAVAAVSLAAALAACDQAPAAGGLGVAPAPAAPAAPAAEEPGLRTETLIVAIVADEDASLAATPAATPAGRANATRTATTPDTTLSFPSDFGTPVAHTDETFSLHYEYSATLPQASITQTVIDRGGVIPWASANGGESWHAGGFDLGGGLVKLSFEYRAGDSEDGPDAAGSITVHLAAAGTKYGEGVAPKFAVERIANYIRDNSLLIRFFVVTDV